MTAAAAPSSSLGAYHLIKVGSVIQLGRARVAVQTQRQKLRNCAPPPRGRRLASATTPPLPPPTGTSPTTTTTTGFSHPSLANFGQSSRTDWASNTTRQLRERHEDGRFFPDAWFCFELQRHAASAVRRRATSGLACVVLCCAVWCVGHRRSYLFMPASPPSDCGALR